MHLPDSTLRLTLTFSRISSSLYLFCDHILWFGRMGLFDIDKSKWSNLSNKFWLYSIVMNLIRDFYEIQNILKASSFSRYSQPRGKVVSENLNLEAQFIVFMNWISRNKNVSLDTFKNFCDFWIPLNSLGHVKAHPGVIGLCGAISSFAAIIQIIDISYRLSPS